MHTKKNVLGANSIKRRHRVLALQSTDHDKSVRVCTSMVCMLY